MVVAQAAIFWHIKYFHMRSIPKMDFIMDLNGVSKLILKDAIKKPKVSI
jgi:hypothetical protein